MWWIFETNSKCEIFSWQQWTANLLNTLKPWEQYLKISTMCNVVYSRDCVLKYNHSINKETILGTQSHMDCKECWPEGLQAHKTKWNLKSFHMQLNYTFSRKYTRRKINSSPFCSLNWYRISVKYLWNTAMPLKVLTKYFFLILQHQQSMWEFLLDKSHQY
jgi:hypothetical protein